MQMPLIIQRQTMMWMGEQIDLRDVAIISKLFILLVVLSDFRRTQHEYYVIDIIHDILLRRVSIY